MCRITNHPRVFLYHYLPSLPPFSFPLPVSRHLLLTSISLLRAPHFLLINTHLPALCLLSIFTSLFFVFHLMFSSLISFRSFARHSPTRSFLPLLWLSYANLHLSCMVEEVSGLVREIFRAGVKEERETEREVPLLKAIVKLRPQYQIQQLTSCLVNFHLLLIE